MTVNYPLKFEPILKEKIWGGKKLSQVLNKKTDKINIGESWEISDVDDDISIVSNGDLQGKTLQDLLQSYKENLVGKKVYNQFGNKFPLLIKYIDAKEPLSIQLHPNDTLAKKRHNSFGKTEMWYVMQADENANLIVGFNKRISKEEYLSHVNNKNLVDSLNFDIVKKGDVYFITTGLVHAIGAGVLLAEIQQTSDITYRIYDWERQDDQGNKRELHTEYAMDAIDLSTQETYKTNYNIELNETSNIIDCQYFTTNILMVDKNIKIDNSNRDSFIIYMCTDGAGVRIKSLDFEVNLNYGETVLIPASLNNYNILPINTSKLLEVYIS